MKIATWNVNSIRTRLEHVLQWLQDNPVDVLCLQETKVVDKDFPRSLLEQLGYHIYVSGQKSYNGVAILSRSPLEDVSIGFGSVLGTEEFDEQKRAIAGNINGIRIVNVYVPNGSSVGSDKYAYKLTWLKALRQYLQTLLTHKPAKDPLVETGFTASEVTSQSLVICGDFNIAPEDRDIHNPALFKNSIMASDLERQALQEILELGLADAFRKFTTDGGHFSWWDYRAGAFQRDRGWRIDHHYLTPDLYEKSTSCIIDKAPRKLEKPSDHTPVVVEF